MFVELASRHGIAESWSSEECLYPIEILFQTSTVRSSSSVKKVEWRGKGGTERENIQCLDIVIVAQLACT